MAEKKTTIWMEQGYTRGEIATRMLAAEPTLDIYMSPRQLANGAHGLPFPQGDDRAFTAQANQLIHQHNINIMWPQHSAKRDLNGTEADIHRAAPPDVIRLLDDKMRFTDWLGDDPFRAQTELGIGVRAVADLIGRAEQEGREICVKPVIGVSGRGYWRLTKEGKKPFLDDPFDREIHPDIYLAALEKLEQERGQDHILVMDWLREPEISVDILGWRGEPLIHAARAKLSSTRQRITDQHEVIPHARGLVRRLGLHGVISVQYMQNALDEWKILEINPRPAGGSIKSEDAGFGILSGLAKLLAGTAKPEDLTQVHQTVMLESRRAHTVYPISE